MSQVPRQLREDQAEQTYDALANQLQQTEDAHRGNELVLANQLASAAPAIEDGSAQGSGQGAKERCEPIIIDHQSSLITYPILILPPSSIISMNHSMQYAVVVGMLLHDCK